MPRDTLFLVRRATDRPSSARTHARRLRDRSVADDVVVATYDRDPAAELRDAFRAAATDRAFVVPYRMAHTRATLDGVPAALSALDAPVSYCQPVGRHAAVTEAIRERASALAPATPDTSLVLAGFGDCGTPHNRQAVEEHAARLRSRSDYGEVVPCYLLQNPAVECVRYNVANDRTVAVPLFVDASDATAEQIPAKLDLDRGGVAYADPLADHPAVTDAIESAVAAERAVADPAGEPRSFEATLTAGPALATDGDGREEPR